MLGFIGTALAAAALGGGGVYLWQRGQLTNVVQNQPANVVSTDQVGNQTTNRAAPEDTRKLLTWDDETGYGVDNLFSCLPKELDANSFNDADATTTVPFDSVKLGFSLDVPWNPAWGTSACRVNPFELTSTGDGYQALLFGPLIEGEGGLGRLYSLRVLPGRSASKASDAIQTENSKEFLTEGPTHETIAGFETVTYATSGLCDLLSVELINPLGSNYQLNGGCGTPPFTELRALFTDVLGGFRFKS
ncbi:MAG: hypothetical protein U0514_03085 [Candidatus Andersenbacteria bacterium]